MKLLKIRIIKSIYFAVLIILFASCGTYRISTDTLRQELQLVNDSLPSDRLVNISAQYRDVDNRQKKDVQVTVDRKEQMWIYLKTGKDSLVQDSYDIVNPHYSNNRKLVFPNNAWIQNDTLYYVVYCHDTNFKAISLSSIDYAETKFVGIIHKGKIRRGIWIEPSTAQRIDGLSISFATMPDLFCNVDTVNINGVNLGIETQWIFGAAMGTLAGGMALGMGVGYVIVTPIQYVGSLFKKKPQAQDTIADIEQDSIDYMKEKSDMDSIQTARRATIDSLCRKDTPPVTVTGFNLGILGSSWQKNNNVTGVNICGIGTISNQIKGFSLTGGVSVIEEQNGVVISGLVNVVQKGKGLQIGVVNYSKQFKGMQFGLWNRNEKRSLPIVNWNFR